MIYQMNAVCKFISLYSGNLAVVHAIESTTNFVFFLWANDLSHVINNNGACRNISGCMDGSSFVFCAANFVVLNKKHVRSVMVREGEVNKMLFNQCGALSKYKPVGENNITM